MLVEEFYAWKLLGCSDPYRLPAKLIDTIFLLENEWRTEVNSGQE